jgi:uncharacterized protein (DUF885 family)
MAGTGLGLQAGAAGDSELRQLAKDALGERFDIRAFHDEVLDDGALPLNVLDAQETDWVNTQKSAMK